MDGLLKVIEQNSNYAVLIVLLVIWLVVFLYMLSVEKKVKRIEKDNPV